MHSKKLSRWLKLTFATIGLTALVSTMASLPSQAVNSTPTPLCADGTCWMIFDYTGDYVIWTPPTGINSLHFDAFGAQGGRAGGKGGSVSGEFAVVPASLMIYVGGVGTSGNAVSGGFNGGGTSGSGHADQGSGGGATDIRTSGNLADRVVVAGGGGGTGGWIGGAGGAGGLTMASAGARGSLAGTAGGGGNQSAGGIGGLGVSGGNGTSGLSGQGGTGGSAMVAGGGGGGGGYFGGGGGGADSVAGGGDGAGGGGGSSFATMALTTNVSHLSGVRSGNGLVILKYTFAPNVNSINVTSGSISTTGDATFQVSFDQFVSDLDVWDFAFSGTSNGCNVSNVSGDGYIFTVQVTGCLSGTFKLSLRPFSVFGATFGPTQETYANSIVTVDMTPANLQISAPPSPSRASVISFTLTSDKPILTPNPAAFDLIGSGCSIAEISMVTTAVAQINVQGCASGANLSLKVKRNQIHDLSGNSSPATDLLASDVTTDYEPPAIASIISSTVTSDTIDYAITFSEPVTRLAASSFSLTGAGCALSKFDGTGSSYHVYVSGCTGENSLTVKSQTARDTAGNYGPVADELSAVASIDTLAPLATFTEIERSDKSQSPSFELRFDELVSGLTINSLSRLGTAANCDFNLVELSQNLVYRVDTANCSTGNLQLRLLSNSVTDTHGNAGPLLAVDSPLVRIVPRRSGIHIASLTALPEVSNELTQPIEIQRLKTTKLITAKSEDIQVPMTSIAAIQPESWVSLVIALMALVIAKRPRGRRRALIRK